MSRDGSLHGSVVLVGERGVLVRGRPGSGKSALVLALIDRDPAGTTLVADDRANVSAANGRLMASVPDALAGRIEIRGQGIDRRPHVSPAAIDLVVDLLPLQECPRLPSDDEAVTEIAGVALPRLCLPIGAAATDAALRVRLALDRRDRITR